MPSVQCFMLERTNKTRRSLRRYADGDCSAAKFGYHNAEIPIEDGIAELDERGSYRGEDEPAEGENRWPTHCACGYEFQDGDDRQLSVELIYRRADTGEEMTLSEAPPGAIYDAPWMPDNYKRPSDGLCLYCKLPNGDYWCMDGPSTDGAGWERTGVAPKLTATPSILSYDDPGWHGWLRDGVLVDA